MIKHILIFLSLTIFTVSSSVSLSADIDVYFRIRKPEMDMVDGQATGAAIQVVKEIFEVAGHTPIFQLVPWARNLKMMENQYNGLSIRHSMDEERSLFMNPILTAYEERVVNFYKKKNNPIDAFSYQDLEQFSIGTLSKNFYSDLFNGNQNLKKITTNRADGILKMLDAGHVDLVITHEAPSLEQLAQDMNIEIETITFKEIYYNGRYISFSRGSDDEQYFMDFNCAAFKVRQLGRVEEIYESFRQKGDPLPVYFQDFKTVESLNQEKECADYKLPTAHKNKP